MIVNLLNKHNFAVSKLKRRLHRHMSKCHIVVTAQSGSSSFAKVLWPLLNG